MARYQALIAEILGGTSRRAWSAPPVTSPSKPQSSENAEALQRVVSPTGLRSLAQCCDADATLGLSSDFRSTLKELCRFTLG